MQINQALIVGAFVCAVAPVQVLASADVLPPKATSFAYSANHPVTPLSDAVIARVANSDERAARDAFPASQEQTAPRLAEPRPMTRPMLCSAMVSVARANGLPAPFFANLIWQESGFNPKVVSPAGAQGIAQFMPKTAAEYGLSNPFEPIHALHAAAKFLSRLKEQFGNLGLAAAAYNAGPGRVSDWVAKRRGLPEETRNYVVRITGKPADRWTSSAFADAPEAKVMPAKAPCAETAREVAVQAKLAQEARLAAAELGMKARAAGSAVRTALGRVKGQVKGQASKMLAKLPAKAAKGPIKLADRVESDAAAPASRSRTVAKSSIEKVQKSVPARSAVKRTKVASAR